MRPETVSASKSSASRMSAFANSSGCSRGRRRRPPSPRQAKRHRALPQNRGCLNSRRPAHFCSMKITEDTRKYFAEQGIAEEQALKKWIEAKSKEFEEKGAEGYAKA